MQISRLTPKVHHRGLRLKGLSSLRTALELLNTGAGRYLGLKLWASRVFRQIEFCTDLKGTSLRGTRPFRTNHFFDAAWKKITADLNQGLTCFYQGRFLKPVPKNYEIVVRRFSVDDNLFHLSIHVENSHRYRQERNFRRFFHQEPSVSHTSLLFNVHPSEHQFLFDFQTVLQPLKRIFPDLTASPEDVITHLLVPPKRGGSVYETRVVFQDVPLQLSILPDSIEAPYSDSGHLLWLQDSGLPHQVRGPLLRNPASHDPNSMLNPSLEIRVSPHRAGRKFNSDYPFATDLEAKAAKAAGRRIYQEFLELRRSQRRALSNPPEEDFVRKKNGDGFSTTPTSTNEDNLIIQQ